MTEESIYVNEVKISKKKFTKEKHFVFIKLPAMDNNTQTEKFCGAGLLLIFHFISTKQLNQFFSFKEALQMTHLPESHAN